MVQGSGFQGSALPLAQKVASLIEKETYEHRTSNIERRMNEFCLFAPFTTDNPQLTTHNGPCPFI